MALFHHGSNRTPRLARRGQLGLSACLLLAPIGACGGGSDKRPETASAYYTNSPDECPPDHTREYYCDDLLPTVTGSPAPAPYDNCPVQTEGHAGRFTAPPVAVFDPSYTEHTRLRAPPGHACCYSWCAPLDLTVPDVEAAQASCSSSAAFRETLCFSAPEGGTSEPVSPQYPSCPVAIKPPAGVSFDSPDSALFDEAGTLERQRAGLDECCYAWCSEAPPTSGITRPKSK